MSGRQEHPRLGSFIAAMDKWGSAMTNHDPVAAVVYAEEMKIFAQFIAEDREFAEVFERHLGGCAVQDASHAMECMHAFFKAMSESSRAGTFRVEREGTTADQNVSSDLSF